MSDENPYRSPTTVGAACGEEFTYLVARLMMGMMYGAMAGACIHRLLTDKSMTSIEHLIGPPTVIACVVSSVFYLFILKQKSQPNESEVQR